MLYIRDSDVVDQMSPKIVGHGACVEVFGGSLGPKDLPCDLGLFLDGAGEHTLEVLARTIIAGCQRMCPTRWCWFGEGRFRRWCKAARIPLFWFELALEYGMIAQASPSRGRRSPPRFAVTERFVLHWYGHCVLEPAERLRRVRRE